MFYGKKLIVATALMAAASMALAGGPVVEPQPNWQGTYIGGDIGYAWGRTSYVIGSDVTTPVDAIFAPVVLLPGPVTLYSFGQKYSGVIGGVQLGQNWQWGNWVAGLESEFDGMNFNTVTTNPFLGLVGTVTTYRTKMNWLFSFTPRLGFACDNWLFFAKLGIAATQIKTYLNSNAVSSTDGLAGPFSFNQYENAYGLDAGAGIDYLFSDHWIFGVVYDYFHFGTISFGGIKTPDDTWPVGYSLNKVTANAVKATIDYKFME